LLSAAVQGGTSSVLDVKRLQVLLSVVELGSVTAAADALMYTPSAVSQQLRRLEHEVGQPLMKRHARGMSPTEAGEVLVLHARKVLRQLAAAEADLQEIAGLRRGRLVLGTFPTVASSFLPLVVRRFQQLHPAIRLDILSGREAQLVEWLENGTVDLSLLWDYEWRRLDPSRFNLTKLFDDPTVLVVAADHRLSRRRRVEMAELVDEDWIVRSDHPVVEVLRRSAVAAGFEPRVSFRANDYQEAQAMVGVGLGIAVAPRTAVLNRIANVRVIPLGPRVPARRVLVAHRPDRVDTAAGAAFHAVLVETGATYRPE
jgi:DNA-binding transcriptional LysR family regulator